MKFKKKILLYIYLILPFCLPELFYFNKYLSIIMVGWKSSSTLWSFILLYKLKFKLNKTEIFILIYISEILLISFSYKTIPSEIVYSAVVVILFIYYMRVDPQIFIKTIVSILELLIIINFITILIFPNGMYTTVSEGMFSSGLNINWFLGYKNPMVRLMIPTCTFSFIYSILYNKKRIIWSWCILAISFITVIIVKSSNGILGILILCFYIFLSNKKYAQIFLQYINLIRTFIVVLIVNFLIVIFRKQVIFSFIINVILNRSSIHLSGRTAIWDAALKVLVENPIWGYGEATSRVLQNQIYAPHPHNYILYVLLQGGVIALLLLTLIIVSANSNLRYAFHENKSYYCIILGAISAFWVIGVGESLTGAYFFYPLFILCQFFKEQKDEKILKE